VQTIGENAQRFTFTCKSQTNNLLRPCNHKQVLPRMKPPSLVGAYGKNRLMLGMELKGKEYDALILGLVIIAILLVVTLA